MISSAYYCDSDIAHTQEAWERFQWHPNADWDFFKLINQIRSEVIGPCVLKLHNGAHIRSLWAGRIQMAHIPFQLGYLQLGSVRVRSLNLLTGGLMGDDSEDACRALLQSALQSMAERKLDLVDLGYVPLSHHLFRLSRDVPAWYSRDWGIISSVHWKMNLPGSLEELLKRRSRKHRYWLKRLPRVLEEAFPGQVKVRQFKESDEVEEFARAAEIVSRKTYQERLGDGFGREYKARCELLASQGALRGYILYLKDEPKAFWLATAYRKTLHLNLTGYEPELKRFEIGTILLMRLFADHCGTSIETVDFGFGGASYKERFGDESSWEAPVRIYSARLPALLVNALNGCNGRLAVGIKAALSRLGLLQWLKTRWRAKLRGSP